MLLKIRFLCIRVLSPADSNKLVICKVLYYVTTMKISIIKSSSDLDNEELLPVSSSSYFKIWSSSDSDTEEEENIDTDGPDISDSEMSESLSFSVYKLWQKIQLHINTDFAVT